MVIAQLLLLAGHTIHNARTPQQQRGGIPAGPALVTGAILAILLTDPDASQIQRARGVMTGEHSDMTPTAARSSAPLRSVQARRQAVLDEVIRIWVHLPGPTGHLLAGVTDDWLIAGIAPAAACYALPPEARSADTVPPWWTWRPSSWSVGHRRDELVLAAAFGLAAIDAERCSHGLRWRSTGGCGGCAAYEPHAGT